MDVFVYSNVFALVGLLTMGTIALTLALVIQSLQLRDWRKRALIAESECKQMHSLYGPHHAKDISANGKSLSLQGSIRPTD